MALRHCPPGAPRLMILVAPGEGVIGDCLTERLCRDGGWAVDEAHDMALSVNEEAKPSTDRSPFGRPWTTDVEFGRGLYIRGLRSCRACT